MVFVGIITDFVSDYTAKIFCIGRQVKNVRLQCQFSSLAEEEKLENLNIFDLPGIKLK